MLPCLQLIAQEYEARNYDWQTPAIHKLSPDELKEHAVIVKEKRMVEYVYDRNGMPEEYYTRHKIIHINEAKSIEEFNRIYIPIDDPADLKSFKARSITASGKVKEMKKEDMKDITEEGNRYLILAIDGLEQDGELEYMYTIKKDVNYYGSETMQNSYLTRNSELSIISPDNLVFGSRSYNGYPQLDDTILDKKRFLTARMEKIMPLEKEKYANVTASQMRVEYNLEHNKAKGDDRLYTWADAGKRVYGNYATLEKGDEKAVSKLLDKLKADGKSDEEKIHLVENYVKTTISLVKAANNKNLADVIKNNYGTRFDICKLCLALFRASGVKTELVLTSSKLERKFDPDFECWNYLDEIFFFFPTVNAYMEPNNYVFRLGQLSYEFTGSYAMFVKPVEIGGIISAVTNIRKIPDATLAENYSNMDIDVSFPADMKSAKEHLLQSYAGYLASSIRPYYFYAPEDKKEELIKDQLKSGMEDAKVTNIKVGNANLNSPEVKKEFTVEADLVVPSLLDKAGDSYLFKLGLLIGPQEEMYQEKPRQLPAEIEFPHSYLRKITVHIPDGYHAKGLEVLNINIDGGKGSEKTMGFKSVYKLDGNTLTVTVTEFYEQLNYPLSSFDQFRKVINAAADFNKITIVLEK